MSISACITIAQYITKNLVKLVEADCLLFFQCEFILTKTDEQPTRCFLIFTDIASFLKIEVDLR